MVRNAILSLFVFSSLCPLCLYGESSDPVRLTTDGGFKQHLSWSPDGKRMLMTRIHDGQIGLWVMNPDGSDLKPLIKPDPKTPHSHRPRPPTSTRPAFTS